MLPFERALVSYSASRGKTGDVFTARCYAERGYVLAMIDSVRLSVRLSACLQRLGTVIKSHSLEYFENNFTAE